MISSQREKRSRQKETKRLRLKVTNEIVNTSPLTCHTIVPPSMVRGGGRSHRTQSDFFGSDLDSVYFNKGPIHRRGLMISLIHEQITYSSTFNEQSFVCRLCYFSILKI